MIAIAAGIFLMAYGLRALFRDCSPSKVHLARIDRLILWGALVDAGLALCAFGAQTAGGTVGGVLVFAWHIPARALAWFALASMGNTAATVDELRGTLRVAPIRAGLLCFGLVASLGVSPFLTPEGRAFALHALSTQDLWLGLLLVAPSVLLLWITAHVVMAVCMIAPAELEPKAIPPFLPGQRGLLLTLAGLLVVLGLGKLSVQAAAALMMGVPLNALPPLESHGWNWALVVLYGGAFPLLLQSVELLRDTSVRLTRMYPCVVSILAFALVAALPMSPLAKLFGLITTGVCGMVCLYSVGYIHEQSRKAAYFFLLLLTFGSVLGVVTSTGAGSLLAYWELMSWASFVLIAWERTPAARSAAIKYLLICGAGAYALMPGLYALAGNSPDLLHAAAENGLSPFTLSTALLFAFVGFAAKAGLVPLHSWLPEAHPEAPSSMSAPLSGVLTKTGIFGLVLVLWVMTGNTALVDLGGGLPGLTGMGSVVVCFGIITMIFGEWKALQQDDLKRMLAYSTIGQIGEIVAVLGIGTWLALTGALTHVLNHAIMKDLLFLCAGALIMRSGSRKLADLAGMARFMPWTTGCMAIGLLAIMGLPPFNGFVGKYVMIVACIQAGHFLLAGALLLASLVGAIYYMRILKVLVFAEPSPRLAFAGASEVPWTMRAPLVILAGLCVLLGVVPQAGLALVTPVANMLAGAGQIDAGFLPGVTVNWTSFVLLPMICAVVPWLRRHDPRQSAYSAAVVLAVTTCMVLIWGRDMSTLSYGMAVLVPLLGALNMVYSMGYMEHSHTQWRFYSFFLLMTGGLLGVVVSTDLFSFFTFWEIMSSWALFFAIAHEGTREAVREAFKYFLFNVAGAACLFLGVGILAGIGHVSNFTDVRAALTDMAPGPWGTVTMALLALGFLMKGAQVALRIDWQMHPNLAPTPVSGYISSVLLKIAVFGMVKLFLEFGGVALQIPGVEDPLSQQSIMYLVSWAGAFTLLYAALKAMMQERIKMVFIWSTVSQIGYMMLGVGLGTSLGVAAGLLHMVNHMIFKDLLFLMAGSVMFVTHKERLDELGGLGRAMPVTMLCFMVAALAAAGVPPTGGFTSKWLVYQALMQEGEVLLALISLVGSVITLAYLARVLHVVFLGQPSAAAAHAQEAPRIMLVPMLILVGVTFITGLFPGLVLLPINSVLAQCGLPMLDISMTGVNSGAGAWNAMLLSTLSLLTFGGLWWGTQKLMALVPERRTGLHACGNDASQDATRMPAVNVYQAVVQLLRLPRPQLPPDLPTVDTFVRRARACKERLLPVVRAVQQWVAPVTQSPKKGA